MLHDKPLQIIFVNYILFISLIRQKAVANAYMNRYVSYRKCFADRLWLHIILVQMKSRKDMEVWNPQAKVYLVSSQRFASEDFRYVYSKV